MAHNPSLHRWGLLFFPPLLLGTLLLTVPQLADDIWWRVGVGDSILRERTVPTTNRYSYLQGARPWTDHAWGYSALMAVTYQVVGLRGLRLLHLGLLLLVGLLALRPCNGMDLLWVLPGALLLLSHHALRPYLVSDLLFLLLFAHLSRHRWRLPESLKGLLPLFLLWTNLHGSALFGLLLALFFTFPLQRKPLLPYAGAALLLMGVLFLSPNGHRGVVLSLQYMVGQHPFLPNLLEWRPPGVALFLTMGFFAFFATWGLPYSLRIGRGALVSLALFAVAMVSRRHIPLFVLVVLCTLRFPHHPPPRLPRTLLIASLALLLLGALFVPPPLNQRPFYPKELFTQLEQTMEFCHTPHPRVFTLHRWSGALLFHFRGRTRHYIDARNDCYTTSLFRCYDRIQTLKPGWEDCLFQLPPDFVLLEHGAPLARALTERGYQVRFTSKTEGVLLVRHMSCPHLPPPPAADRLDGTRRPQSPAHGAPDPVLPPLPLGNITLDKSLKAHKLGTASGL